MAALEVRMAEFLTARKKILGGLTVLIEKKKDELQQTFQSWTSHQVINWLRFLTHSDAIKNKFVTEQLNMANFNGSRLHEINDSWLSLAGIVDLQQRKLILKAVDKLFDKYGGRKYNKLQLCCICRENEVNTCLVPCGHLCYCDECGQRSFYHTNECPICRKRINTLIRTFKTAFES